MPAVHRIFPRSVSLITKRRTIRSVERLSGDALKRLRTMNFNFRALLQLSFVSRLSSSLFSAPPPSPRSNNKRRKRLGVEVVSPLAIYRNSLRAKLVGVKKGRFPRRCRFFLVKRFTRDHLSEGNEFKRTGSW